MARGATEFAEILSFSLDGLSALCGKEIFTCILQPFPVQSDKLWTLSYGKISSASTGEALWRDGRAAEGACLENMFGSHQRGFESHSLRSIYDFRLTIFDCQS